MGGVINLVQQNIIMFMFCCWFVAQSNIIVKFPLLEIILAYLSFKNQCCWRSNGVAFQWSASKASPTWLWLMLFIIFCSFTCCYLQISSNFCALTNDNAARWWLNQYRMHPRIFSAPPPGRYEKLISNLFQIEMRISFF